MILGITGGSGTGKSSIARQIGFFVIDADSLYHELLRGDDMLKGELKEEFGTFERRAIAGIVFSDKSRLERLNEITFKYTMAKIEKELKNLPADANAIIDAPLLFESGLNRRCDFTVAVLAETQTRINRISDRDHISKEQAARRISAQKPDEYYIQKADYIIRNEDGDLEKAAAQLKKILGKI
ncbi:MAG: dephospho-CoA kinase [Oscillospiraceae bacterium]|nr:dephospho-CoA kinase [Oscillospiraceae bacterium]